MARALIRLGDSTSHGGSVTEASMTMRSGNIGIARVGDKVSCPIPGHGDNTIATGDPTFILDGRPVARDGDKTECGATLIPSQFVTTVSNETNIQPTKGRQPDPSPHVSAELGRQSCTALSSETVPQEQDLEHYFEVINSNGSPVNLFYRIDSGAEKLHEGALNSQGITKAVSLERNINVRFWSIPA